MDMKILILTEDFEKWIEKFRKSFNQNKSLIENKQKYCLMEVGNKDEISFEIILFKELKEEDLRGRRFNYTVIDKAIGEEEKYLLDLALFDGNIKKTENWFKETYESKY